MSMTISSMARNSMADDMLRIATGRRINSAADDAAGQAIAEQLRATANGFRQGADNTADMGNLVNTAEGALGGISDSLQRVRELSIQAGNGTLNDRDRQAIQGEINQLMEGIQSNAANTEFNSIRLLDGNFADRNVASNPDGSGMRISIENTSLEALGLDNFDVTSGNFDIGVIDNAISAVSSSRSNLGAISNALEHVISANNNAHTNQVAALSRIEDADIALESINRQRREVMDQMSIFNLRNQTEQMQNMVNIIS